MPPDPCRRKTQSYSREEALYLEGLARGLGVPEAELIRDTVIRFAAQYTAERRQTANPADFRKKQKPRPHVDLVEAIQLIDPEVPVELIRRRIALGWVRIDGQPFIGPNIAPRLIDKIEWGQP